MAKKAAAPVKKTLPLDYEIIKVLAANPSKEFTDREMATKVGIPYEANFNKRARKYRDRAKGFAERTKRKDSPLVTWRLAPSRRGKKASDILKAYREARGWA